MVGDACVPEIKILEPEPDETEYYAINFQPTLLGEKAYKSLVFKNVGVIGCKVIVELCYDEYDQMCLEPTEETIGLLNLWEAGG